MFSNKNEFKYVKAHKIFKKYNFRECHDGCILKGCADFDHGKIQNNRRILVSRDLEISIEKSTESMATQHKTIWQ